MKNHPLIIKIFVLIFVIICFNSCTDEDSADLEVNQEFLETFEQVWSDFDITYPYFDHKNIDWNAIYIEYLERIIPGMSEREFSELIGEMTLELRDIHVRFYSPYHSMQYSIASDYAENPPDYAINYLENSTIENDYVYFADISNTNYSYLRIKKFTGSELYYTGAINKLAEIEHKDGLIIDIRSNPGGNELLGRAFAGVLSNEDRVYRYSRYRNGPDWNDFTDWYSGEFESNTDNAFSKGIILLTNRRCYSSAELFTLMMDVIPNVTIVGDTTYGASANPGVFTYYNDWEIYISRWQLADINYNLIEDRGVAPDYQVTMTSETMLDDKDLILEKAIELLNNQVN